MSIVADFSVPAEAFCLGDSLATVPEATAELDRVVAHSPAHVMPFVWVLDTDLNAFADAVVEDPTVEQAEVTDSFEAAHLFQFYWADIVSKRLQLILDHNGVVLEARGAGDQWRLWVRFGDQENFSEFQDHFQEFGEVTLHRLTSPQMPGTFQYGVSAKQREALLAAYDLGYYDTPSAVNGADIADQLEITQQAVSERLQRGAKTLIKNTLDRHRTD